MMMMMIFKDTDVEDVLCYITFIACFWVKVITRVSILVHNLNIILTNKNCFGKVKVYEKCYKFVLID